LQNFHNRLNGVAREFSIVDLPGAGLYFTAGNLPIFSNSAGVTYDIRFQVAGSNVWHTHATGINAGQPFNFTLPQTGDIRYTSIGFFFGDVPANFGLGNTIVLTFTAGDTAPNGTLVNRFVVGYNYGERTGEGSANLVNGPTPGPGNVLQPNGNGYIELDDNGVPQGTWEWDNDEEIWIFSPNIPLGRIPQTGWTGSRWFALIMNIATVSALGAILFVVTKRKRANTL